MEIRKEILGLRGEEKRGMRQREDEKEGGEAERKGKRRRLGREGFVNTLHPRVGSQFPCIPKEIRGKKWLGKINLFTVWTKAVESSSPPLQGLGHATIYIRDKSQNTINVRQVKEPFPGGKEQFPPCRGEGWR